MDLGNHARAQMRRPGGVRVAVGVALRGAVCWRSRLAARRRARGRGRRLRSTRFPRSSTRFGRSAWCPFPAATPMATRSRRSSGARRGSSLRCDRQRHRRRVRQFAVSGRDGSLHPRRGRAGIDGPAGVARRGAAGDRARQSRTPPCSSAQFARRMRSGRPSGRRASCSVTRRSIGRTSAPRPTTASGKSSATPIRPTWSGGSCSRTIGAR